MDNRIAEKDDLLQTAKRKFRAGWLAFTDVVTPPRCLICHQHMAAGAAVCNTCWQKLRFIEEPVCDALGVPFEFEQGPGALSPAAIVNPPVWDRARAAVVFDDSSKHLVHQLKYNDMQEAGIAMARMMAGAGRHLVNACDVILPVPLHRIRMWQRRFNQSAYLAKRIAERSCKDCRMNVLVRQKRTLQQVGLTAEERRKNVRRAFTIPLGQERHVEGRSVLLVDDVRTTGATLSACAETVRQAGATHIAVLTFALVLEPLRPHIDA